MFILKTKHNVSTPILYFPLMLSLSPPFQLRPWTSPPHSLFADPAKPKNAKWKAMDWKRAAEMGVKNPRLYADGMNADDIKQGGIGDCWLMSGATPASATL